MIKTWKTNRKLADMLEIMRIESRANITLFANDVLQNEAFDKINDYTGKIKSKDSKRL